MHLNANTTEFESSRIQSESISGRSHLRLCQATCMVLLSADVLAPAGLYDLTPGQVSPASSYPVFHMYTGSGPVTDGQTAVQSKRLASKDIH